MVQYADGFAHAKTIQEKAPRTGPEFVRSFPGPDVNQSRVRPVEWGFQPVKAAINGASLMLRMLVLPDTRQDLDWKLVLAGWNDAVVD